MICWCVKFGKQTYLTHMTARVDTLSTTRVQQTFINILYLQIKHSNICIYLPTKHASTRGISLCQMSKNVGKYHHLS